MKVATLSRKSLILLTMGDETWRDRLKQALKEKRRKKRSVSIAAGLSHGYIHGILEEGKEPSVVNLVAIAKELGISASWLLLGMEISEEDERLLEIFSGLDKDQRDALLRLAETWRPSRQ